MCALYIDFSEQLDLLNVPIKIDFLAMINKDTKLSKVYDILLESAIKNLRLYESVLQKYIKNHVIKSEVALPETLHFFPKDCGHFLTRIVFDDSEEELSKCVD